jgi:hypothetical protein
MPSLPNLDEFSYCAQDEDLPACVPACVVMVYEHLGIEHTWEGVTIQLEFDPLSGTPFDHLYNLASVRAIPVTTLEEIERHLADVEPVPVIANLFILNDAVLGYTLDQSFSLHAVVVLALDDYQVVFSDPLSHAMLSTEAHSICSRSAFEQAWFGGVAILRLGDAARIGRGE